MVAVADLLKTMEAMRILGDAVEAAVVVLKKFKYNDM